MVDTVDPCIVDFDLHSMDGVGVEPLPFERILKCLECLMGLEGMMIE